MSTEEEKHRVRVGKNGYLFQTDEDIFGRLTGEVNLSEKDLAKWTVTFRERISVSGYSNARYFMFVVPERHVVYREFLPDGVLISEDRPITRLIRHFEEKGLSDSIVYPIGFMESARRMMAPYPKGGSHWNGFGAYVGYRAICAEVGVTPDHFDEFEWTYEPVPGGCDLEERLSLDPGPYTMFKKKLAKGAGTFDNAIWSGGNVKVFTNRNSDLPKAVIFRDSFAMKLLPLLCESFSRIVAVATGWFWPELIATERPHFVITQLAERYVTSHMADYPTKSFEDLCKISALEISQK